ncbi:E3 ubiquitin-protein ligase RNF166 isoform X2 [Pyxicephalus adspersus]|uniref:E3 ubiquitin-protein ligase RNF166 isoform X2 n=1 Tax=Pyxicephalus adspersus TaxID=30357 RepID=UPI003B5CB160
MLQMCIYPVGWRDMAVQGLVLSINQSEEPSSVKQDITEKWTSQVPLSHTEDATQEELCNESLLNPLEIQMDNALLVLTNELPLKDSLNNLHTPPRNRTAEAGLSELVNKATFGLPSQAEMGQVSDSDACLDFQKMGRLHSKHKLRHCRYFSCPHCSKSYSSLGALKMHIRTHTLPCACRICGKAFSRPWLLQGHIRTHTGEKPFSCYHCGRGFADRSNLRAHLQTHSEVKRYRCPGCGKTFSRISLLTKHRDGCCCPDTL